MHKKPTNPLIDEESMAGSREHQVRYDPTISLGNVIIHIVVQDVVVCVGVAADHRHHRTSGMLEVREDSHKLLVLDNGVVSPWRSGPAAHRVRHVMGHHDHVHILRRGVQEFLQPFQLRVVEIVVFPFPGPGTAGIQEDDPGVLARNIVIAPHLARSQVQGIAGLFLPGFWKKSDRYCSELNSPSPASQSWLPGV